jgi:DNA (cytosine-5)-methyltransferase 1
LVSKLHPPPETSVGPRVVELFAGVGGFRIALERSGWQTVWSNQWEPSTRRQHASDCYVARFGAEGHVNADIHQVLDRAEVGEVDLPDHELLVGGSPCQDYSVAKTLNQAHGLVGKKGVLWWEIHRLLRLKRPPFVLLENVDRLLKSPAGQRGRDVAVMLASLSDLGYEVEWRVVNAADYGFPQKRRRVYIIGRLRGLADDPWSVVFQTGALARALPVSGGPSSDANPTLTLDDDLAEISATFGTPAGISPFRNAGLMRDRRVWTVDLVPRWAGPRLTLGDVLEPPDEVPPEYYVPVEQLPAWRYLKGAKREQRTHRASGTPYEYVEGSIPFPDLIDGPSRTILTAEGGVTPSRFKHLIQAADGRYRRLTPRELERLNGFPDDHTATGITDGRRAFLMGNALVVGLVERVGRELMTEVGRSAADPVNDAVAVAL